MKTTIDIENYRITIAQDIYAENPFEAWDCEPPLLTYYGGRHEYFKAYEGAPESLGEIVDMLPDSLFERGQRVKLIREFLDMPLRGFAEYMYEWNYGDECRSAFRELLIEKYGGNPHGWRSAQDWLETAESLLKFAGVPCLCAQSNGYSQGDSTLCLVILTPEWYKLTGAPVENAQADCRAAVDLYSAWAWGDVYGVESVVTLSEDEDGDEIEGEEIEDASCWGFYGWNHEKSGLMDHVRNAIEYHKKRSAKEAQESAYWIERGVITV